MRPVALRMRLRALAGAPTSSGAIVMALGIFRLAVLPQMPAVSAGVVRAYALGLTVVWTVVAASWAASWLGGRLREHTGPVIGRFAIGTWVAGTAMTAHVLVLGMPAWRPLALLLGTFAVGLWLFYLAAIAVGLGALLEHSASALVPGSILLVTVSTQSLALTAVDLFADPAPFRGIAQALLGLGTLFYAAGLIVVLRSFRTARRWTLDQDWDNTNCILHGAMSITGLTVVLWEAWPAGVTHALWLYVLGVFVAVELVELLRLVARVHRRGWRQGVFSYRVTQWSRVFTFGMFYGFTWAYAQAGLPHTAWGAAIQRAILDGGRWVVLAFLLGEVLLRAADQRREQHGSAQPRRRDARLDLQ